MLFAEPDVVSLHLVSNAATRGVVGAAEIAAMKPTAYIVNTSRGALIDEPALIGALHDGSPTGSSRPKADFPGYIYFACRPVICIPLLKLASPLPLA